MMNQEFSEDGVAFSVPEGWTVQREETEEGWAVTLQSPGTAFAMFSMDRTMPETEAVARTALEALWADYPALEARPAIDMLAGEMAIGHDVEFFSLDMASTCWTRSLYAGAGTLLVLCQCCDADEEDYESVLRAVCASLRVVDED
jgi:hypothetical protein